MRHHPVQQGVVCLMLSLLCCLTWAQESGLSSEQRELSEQVARCEDLEHGQPDQAIEVIDSVLRQVDRQQFPFLTIRALGCRAWSLSVLGRADEAAQELAEIEQLSSRLAEPGQQARAMSMLASLNQRQGNSEASLRWLSQALGIALEHDLKQQLVPIYTNLGIENSVAKNHEQAIEYYQLALETMQQTEDQSNRLPILYNLGLTYRGAGELELAASTFQQLVGPLREPGMEVRLASLLTVMASIQRDQGNFEQAEGMYREAMALHENLNNPSERTAVLIDLSYLSLDTSDLEAALDYSAAALETARSSELPMSIRGALQLRSRVLEAAGELDHALEFQRQFNQLNEEYLREQQSTALNQMRAELGFERQAAELAELRAQQQQQEYELNQQQLRQTAGIIIGGLILLGILTAYLWQRRTNRRLTALSQTDQLTGLPNRRRIMDFLTASIHSGNADRFVLMLLDLDYFKKINDDHGHDAGDRALVEVADRMRNFAKTHEIEVGRWGGEEFLLLFKSDSPDQTIQLAEQLLDEVASVTVETREQPIHLSASAGLVPVGVMQPPDNQQIWEPALLATDQLLYRAKKAGRNNFFGIWPRQAEARTEPHDLDAAIESSQFQLLSRAR